MQRTRYRIQQRITYRYDGPVRSLQQRLVVQPRSVHGDQRRISRRLSVLDATPRQVDASVDVFGNTVVTLEHSARGGGGHLRHLEHRRARRAARSAPGAGRDARRSPPARRDAAHRRGSHHRSARRGAARERSDRRRARVGRERVRPQRHDLRARRDVGRAPPRPRPSPGAPASARTTRTCCWR